ncbi:hypothetical protein BCR41DRAFT_166676 [Lobosporangium transversale]|uniref:Autophagy-related protein 29 n=1 Tax=Lobosporangium transversale TaxID=64571 RepID=A0A1Y2GE54_9FUNG|nr:hypothetical protein BCR41DRAFT_166676 [Lobosporangium transversale]ORZ06829.1 hypothetical protein BCR41DRAFT_166676 [Lobosporangium transversale]|eukprot:XP_021877750.1 hypothetical protein BCR41DRAFT_166676 [Lobosporangium transversale]
MDPSEEPIHVIIRLPYPRPEGFVDTPVRWTEAMEKTLWQIIGQTKPSLVDWNAVSRQLGNIPVHFLIRHAASLYQNQLQDLHRIGELQDSTGQLQSTFRQTTRGAIGPGAPALSFDGTPTAQQHSLSSQGALKQTESPRPNVTSPNMAQPAGKEIHGAIGSKTQASPSLSDSISAFPSSMRPASMSSSASTIRPVQPSSPSPSIRSAATAETNMYNSGALSKRGISQSRSSRGSQLLGTASERRIQNALSTISTSPREGALLTEASQRITEPAHPFHQATISASVRHSNILSPSARISSGSHDQGSLPAFQEHERSSTVSSVSTPYSQSNSTSQIFEETSFFNQLSSTDSISRGQQQRTHDVKHDELASGEAFQQLPFRQNEGTYGLGFMHHAPYFSGDNNESNADEDDGNESSHTDDDADSTIQDESGSISEQIKQLHLEDVLAFLPSGGASASSILQKKPLEQIDNIYQRRTASGNNMLFHLDDELANLGTRALEEIMGHDGEDEDDHRVQGIRFKETVIPNRVRAQGRDGDSTTKIKTSPERSGPNSRKSSAQNSVGSSFSDLSDSSVTQSAMEDAYLSGYNNSKM